MTAKEIDDQQAWRCQSSVAVLVKPWPVAARTFCVRIVEINEQQRPVIGLQRFDPLLGISLDDAQVLMGSNTKYKLVCEDDLLVKFHHCLFAARKIVAKKPYAGTSAKSEVKDPIGN
ncbi:MAG: hypothetical protein EBZ03_08880 [Betaproteobacteria bacterium]|nr:hypothetical protein [Betaproteobacteria bacterium]NBO43330.1 hypothetical protein [Betaproteobacteria bacterium]NBS20958.1 hypothetical protein [Betaproteobacteria bacterium]NBU66376.1 hypothetical protein [Betaproteobacteria bacterium]NCV05680.1 hypothetical protein [Betaproteobacteria bacterium]